MAYFSLIPNELLLELSLYFNYRDSILYCNIWKCNDIRFWLNKIRKELGYSDEFITEYVYDTRNNTMKTLLPINEKYLELKARKTADFGCEFYKNPDELFVYSSRLKDFSYADELTLYLLQIYKYRFPGFHQLKDGYLISIRGAIGVGNIQLADKLIQQSNGIRINLSDADINTELQERIILGIYENGDLELLDYYNIDVKQITNDIVIEGLATGGHLDKLREYGPLVNADNLYNAAQLGRKNIIHDFPQLLNYENIIKYLLWAFGFITKYKECITKHAKNNFERIH